MYVFNFPIKQQYHQNSCQFKEIFLQKIRASNPGQTDWLSHLNKKVFRQLLLQATLFRDEIEEVLESIW
jgi:hypothetical protein